MSDVHVDTELDMAAAEATAETRRLVEEPQTLKKTNGVSELARLNDTIESLYVQKCQQLQDMKARHAEERIRTINDHERHYDELMRRAAQAMRDMDGRQHAEMAPLHELIRRLEDMRL